MRRSNTDLLAMSVLALLAALVSTAFGNSNFVKAALSVPFLLFLPGYALSAALLPDGRMGLAERIAIAIGLSVAVAALAGLLLNFLPSGLSAGAWRILLLGVTLTSAALAFWRRQTGTILGPGPLSTQVSARQIALVGGAALLIGLALGLGAIGVSPTLSNAAAGRSGFTQFWALPHQDGEQRVIQLGLHNYEQQSVTYRVTVEAEVGLLAEWPEVTVKNGESWQAQATVPAQMIDQDVTASAYREGSSTPYRRVRVASVSRSAR